MSDVAKIAVPCVDWQWAIGKIGPRCRRAMSCGASVPDDCPAARRAHLLENHNAAR